MHFPNSFIRRNGDHINGQHHAAVQAGQLINHRILNVAGVLLQEQHTAIFVSHDKMVFFEFQAVRADDVLVGMTFPHTLLEVKPEIAFLAHTIEIVQNAEPLSGIQFFALGIQTAEASGNIAGHPVKDGPSFLHTFPMDGQGDVPLLHHAVGRAGNFVHEHGIVLRAVIVQAVIFVRKQDVLLKILAVQPLVVDGDLGGGACVQSVEQFGIAQEHGRFVLF